MASSYWSSPRAGARHGSGRPTPPAASPGSRAGAPPAAAATSPQGGQPGSAVHGLLDRDLPCGRLPSGTQGTRAPDEGGPMPRDVVVRRRAGRRPKGSASCNALGGVLTNAGRPAAGLGRSHRQPCGRTHFQIKELTCPPYRETWCCPAARPSRAVSDGLPTDNPYPRWSAS